MARWYREQDEYCATRASCLTAARWAARTSKESTGACAGPCVASVRFALDSPLPGALGRVHRRVRVTPGATYSNAVVPDDEGRELTYAEALVEGLDQLMSEDPDLVVIGSYRAWPRSVASAFRPAARALVTWSESSICPPPVLAICGLGTGAAMTGLPTMVDIGTASFTFQAFLRNRQ